MCLNNIIHKDRDNIIQTVLGMFQCLRRSNLKISKIGRYRRMFIISTALFCVLFLILLHREIENTMLTLKYQNLVTFQLHPFWKEAAKEQLDGEKEKKDKGDSSPELLVNSTKAHITREELGHNTWQLLHMISGTIPDTFNDDFRYKINSFMNLFGQFYPCKVCATHFLEHTKDFQFTGNTKKQFMVYMCQLHNIVNEAVGHPQYDCSNIVSEWDTCGCSSGKPKAK